MIGKVIEGRYVGASICKVPDKNVLFIETDDGDRIALSQKNVISIDDVTEQYSSYGNKVLMVMWNDFETSILQLGLTTQSQDDSSMKGENSFRESAPKKKEKKLKKSVFVRITAILLVLSILALIAVILFAFVLRKDCGFCGADGKIRCSACKASGNVECETCNAKGRLYCETCKGFGELDCADCNGVGYAEGEKCPGCHGEGRSITMTDLSDIGSSDLLSRMYKNAKYDGFGWWSYTCSKCDGTGIEHVDCKKCNGNGEYTCPGCYGDHFGDTCPDCNGSTAVVCTECTGNGLVSCDKCKGIGKRYIWD